MAPLLPLLLLFLLSPAATAAPTPPTTDALGPATAYDVLTSYNLPAAILPKGVNSYTLDKGSGAFTANFNGACEFSLWRFITFHFDPTIRGTIDAGKVSSLNGVSVKLGFFSINIVQVARHLQWLQVSALRGSRYYPIAMFRESPTCGCGFHCNKTTATAAGAPKLPRAALRGPF